MRLTIDTNVFVYAVDATDRRKQETALEVIEAARGLDCRVSLQTCGELYAVLVRRFRRATWEAAQASRNVLAMFETFGASRGAVERALAEAMAGRFSYWDGLLLASAHEAAVDVCVSEDMADGARLGRVEVMSPFGASGLSERAGAVLRRT